MCSTVRMNDKFVLTKKYLEKIQDYINYKLSLSKFKVYDLTERRWVRPEYIKITDKGIIISPVITDFLVLKQVAYDKTGHPVYNGDILKYYGEFDKGSDTEIVPALGFVDLASTYINMLSPGYCTLEDGLEFDINFYEPDGSVFSWNKVKVCGNILDLAEWEE